MGVDPSTLNSQTQLKQLLAYVKQAEDAAFNQMNVLSGKDAENALKKFMGQDTSADVFDLTGKKIDTSQGIMGGKSVKDLMESGEVTQGTVTKKSDKVRDREMFKEANERFKKTETEEEILERLNRENKEATKNLQIKLSKDKGYQKYKGKTEEELRAQFGLDDEPEKFYTGGIVDVEPNLSDIGHGSDALMSRTRLMSPGSQATTSTGLNYLLAEDNDNIRVPFNEGKTYKQKLEEEIKKRLKYKRQGMEFDKPLGPEGTFNTGNPPKVYELAEGGRIGFKSGTDLRKRAFLKLMAALTGGIASIKSGLIGLSGKEAPAQVTKEVVKQSVPDVPPHFLKLVETITKFGDDTIATQDKVIAKKYKDYYMEKDFAGNIEITKTKMGANEFGEGPIEEVYMKYTAPDDAIPDGKSTVVKRGEYEEFTARPDMEGKMKDVEDGVPDDIVEEVMTMDDTIIKKAEGGRIGFSVGKSFAKLLADKTITGSSRRFLEKVFGKESFENMIENDPELYRGLLETVEMFRKRDKEGLKMYMQKFLPHMDDETVEDFIIGSGGTEGIQGQLIRLGSGRDYAGKIEMMKRADQMKKLNDLEITDEMVRKPNASGGIAKLLGE